MLTAVLLVLRGQTNPVKKMAAYNDPGCGAHNLLSLSLQSSTVENVASDSAEQILAVSLFSEETTLFDHNLAP